MSEDRAPYATGPALAPTLDARPADADAGTIADPLLTTAQAAAYMGKSYKQFTAYASHHKLPREGKPPTYRASVLDKAMGKAAGPLAVTENAENTDPAAVSLPVVFRGILADKDRQIEQVRGQLVEMAEAKGAALERARQAEQRLVEMEQRAAERDARTEQAKPLSVWQRWFGRGG